MEKESKYDTRIEGKILVVEPNETYRKAVKEAYFSPELVKDYSEASKKLKGTKYLY